jgi:hypothetical protein
MITLDQFKQFLDTNIKAGFYGAIIVKCEDGKITFIKKETGYKDGKDLI